MENRQVPDSSTWYTRRAGQTKGPFPTGMVRRFVLLGRVRVEDEVSADGREWWSVGAVDALIPKPMRRLETEEDYERLRLARLHADERTRERRAAGATTGPRRRKGDRRQPEPPEFVAHRHARQRLQAVTAQDTLPRWPMAVLVALMLVLVGSGVYLAVAEPETDMEFTACGDMGGAPVHWSNCKLEGLNAAGAKLKRALLDNTDLRGANLRGADLSKSVLAYSNLSSADLSYANLAGASLVGAGMRQVDLSHARLAGADLSYADLRGARLQGADLAKARLGKALWTDGSVCAPQSLGSCLPVGIVEHTP